MTDTINVTLRRILDSIMRHREEEIMIREIRNGLRPVTAIRHQKEVKGYFHCFGQEGNLEDGIGIYATIELEDGTVTQVDAYKMKFDDNDRLKVR
jgi:hypothetical protein